MCVFVFYMFVFVFYMFVFVFYMCVFVCYMCVFVFYMCVFVFYMCVFVCYMCVFVCYMCVFVTFMSEGLFEFLVVLLYQTFTHLQFLFILHLVVLTIQAQYLQVISESSRSNISAWVQFWTVSHFEGNMSHTGSFTSELDFWMFGHCT